MYFKTTEPNYLMEVTVQYSKEHKYYYAFASRIKAEKHMYNGRPYATLRNEIFKDNFRFHLMDASRRSKKREEQSYSDALDESNVRWAFSMLFDKKYELTGDKSEEACDLIDEVKED